MLSKVQGDRLTLKSSCWENKTTSTTSKQYHEADDVDDVTCFDGL